MKKFSYTAFTPCHVNVTVNGKPQHISLHRNEQYDLPAEDIAVKRLIALGYLKPVEVNNSTQPTKTV